MDPAEGRYTRPRSIRLYGVAAPIRGEGGIMPQWRRVAPGDVPLHCVVRFPAQWINASRLEWALRNSCGPVDPKSFEASFEFPSGCKVMVDAAIRLLSLVNQLASTTRRVRLNFEEGETGTMGYLNRTGFFDHLADAVEVLPSRPRLLGGRIASGRQRGAGRDRAHQQGRARRGPADASDGCADAVLSYAR